MHRNVKWLEIEIDVLIYRFWVNSELTKGKIIYISWNGQDSSRYAILCFGETNVFRCFSICNGENKYAFKLPKGALNNLLYPSLPPVTRSRPLQHESASPQIVVLDFSQFFLICLYIRAIQKIIVVKKQWFPPQMWSYRFWKF